MIFTLDGIELRRALEFKDYHDRKEHGKTDTAFRYAGAICGAYSLSFTPTSIGTAVSVECSCGATEDVTDYDAW